MPCRLHRATPTRASRGPSQALAAAVCIALLASLAVARPAQGARPFNHVEESAVQVAIEYWGRAPACLGGFGRFVVTDEEMDARPGAAGRRLAGYAVWNAVAAQACRIITAQRSKRQGYAAFCTTVTHELGHLIRLDDWHSRDPADVMHEGARPPTPHCRARAASMAARSARLDVRADGLRRRCRRLMRVARTARYRRCSRRVKTVRSRASALLRAVDAVRP